MRAEELRELTGWSVRDLAELFGCSMCTVYRLGERRTRRETASLVEALVHVVREDPAAAEYLRASLYFEGPVKARARLVDMRRRMFEEA